MKLEIALLCAAAVGAIAAPPQQPKIEARKAPVLTRDGLKFRDLNKNGTLDRYEDWRLPVEERVADLLSKMTVEEKAGLMIHSSLAGFTGPNGEVLGLPAAGGRGGRGGRGAGPGTPGDSGSRAFQGPDNPNHVEPMGSANPAQLIVERNVRWILVRPNAGEAPEITAKFHNGLQEMAEASRLGIPLVFSTDPRHGVGRGGGDARPVISQWPDQLGLAAARDPELVREFGRIAAKELRALGIQVLLGPMADTATEPRWNRISGTFGEDAKLNATLIRAIVEGFQGKQLGAESVMTVTKHFPGDGPVKDGYDPHNSYGKWTIYPGNRFEDHLIPFRAALDAGTGAIMGGYFIPVGRDSVGINFSHAMITGLLREKMGFHGVVITDWLRNMPWGVETLSEKDRQKAIVLAGVDQIGGDNDPRYILASARDGGIPMPVIDASARRVLRPMFDLGVFEDPYVDPGNARAVVASAPFVDAGYSAQVKSTVLLKNANQVLPLGANRKIYVEGMSREAAGQYGTVVDDVKDADVAILRVASPATTYPYGGAFAPGGGGGRGAGGASAAPPPVSPYGITLAYGNAANWTALDSIRKAAATGKPTIVVVNMDKPVILTEFIDSVAAIFGAFGASDRAVLDLVFGKQVPSGKLPFDLPGDMPSVMAQAADVPFDMDNPLFRFGFGLSYERR